MPRVHRERFVRNGFLREAMMGWMISCNPNADSRDTAQWIAAFREFCASYCTSGGPSFGIRLRLAINGA
ncbi:MAG: hypothetical protein OXN84_13430 [Albidovulum sp.]|nr:hypothetical protein [Albidovulum sp.]